MGTHGESSWEGVVGCDMGGDVIVCLEITCLSLHGLQTMGLGLGPSIFPCWAQNKIYFFPLKNKIYFTLFENKIYQIIH